jgi:hypothetical protein
MAFFALFPIALLGVVILAVAGVSAAVELLERRRARLYPTPRRRFGFRPRVIEGGRRDEVQPQVKAAPAPASDKLAG